MNSREKILSRVKQNQPEAKALPDIDHFHGNIETVIDRFRSVLVSIGGEVHMVNTMEEIQTIVGSKIPDKARVVNLTDVDFFFGEEISEQTNPHSLENVYLAILRSPLGVAENGAIWLTAKDTRVRALPFICEHLAVILSKEKIVPTLHEAYDILEISDHDYGVFIAGPSKTADIEQSLVLGAHGSKSMTVFIM
ncbi:MAG TPA: LUD domain-containing protein [Ohtaekwangia sp.]